ncbi:MAG: TIGR03618 family F420-dependent PPOX class oxidoreductase [Nitriliruptoraceae bacterium]
MHNLEPIEQLASEETGLAVVATTRADGTVQASVVNAGVLPHPVSDELVVGFVTRGGSLKQRNLRQRPACTLTFRRGWRWATVEGDAQLVGPDDPVQGIDGEQLTGLLRAIFRSAGGTHDDWEEYDRVMAEERRTAVLVRPHRVYGSS